MNKTKLTEGQYILRGSMSMAILMTLLALPVVTNVVSYQLGFPLILVVVMILTNLGKPSADDVELGTPRWKWTLLRILVSVAFLLLSIVCVHFLHEGDLHLTTFGGHNGPLISFETTTESSVFVLVAYIVFWMMPAFSISSYSATAITRMIVGKKKKAAEN